MRTLIFGASGKLGGKLYWEASWRGHRVIGTRYRSANTGLIRVDLRNGPAVSEVIFRHRPEVIFVTAGLSDALDAEAHAQECFALHGDGVTHIAQAARRLFGDDPYPKTRVVAFSSGGAGSGVLSRAETLASDVLRMIVPDQHLIVTAARNADLSDLAESAMDLAEGGRVGTCYVGEVSRPLLRAVA